MKNLTTKIVLIGLICVMLIICNMALAENTETENAAVYVVIKDQVNFRKTWGSKGTSLGRIPKGALVYVYDSVQEQYEWLHVYYNDSIGYIRGDMARSLDVEEKHIYAAQVEQIIDQAVDNKSELESVATSTSTPKPMIISLPTPTPYSFLYKDVISFGMNSDEVIAALGKEPDRSETGCLIYEKQTVSGYQAQTWYRFTKNGDLCSIVISFDEDTDDEKESMAQFQSVNGALVYKYGASVRSGREWESVSLTQIRNEDIRLACQSGISNKWKYPNMSITHMLIERNSDSDEQELWHYIEYSNGEEYEFETPMPTEIPLPNIEGI